MDVRRSNILYWNVESQGIVFGPFVNRNHFAFYINLCIGLGLGILLSLRESKPRLRAGGFTALLAHPESLWVLVVLALMLYGELACLSRGGVVALLGATVVCVTLSFRHALRFGAIGAAVLIAGAALVLAVFFAYDPFIARLATFWNGEATHDSRMFLWSKIWPILKSFPLWGTGYGTFRYIEPIYLHTPSDVGLCYEFAHNEYIEGLIEGGVLRLGLMLSAIGLVYRLGVCALLAHAEKSVAALGLGALFAFTALVIHSFVEFGIHIPAIAMLSAVIVALLCGLGQAENDGGLAAGQRPPGWRLVPWGVAATCMSLGIVLVVVGWGQARLEATRHRLDSLTTNTVPALEYKVEWLDFVAGILPEDANVHADLTEAHLGLCDAMQSDDAARHSAERPRIVQQHYGAALRHLLLARDLCPLLPVPHVRIAANRDSFSHADGRGAYLARAKFLDPSDPELWYLCGLQELSDGHEDEAWASWRQSLELSRRFLQKIVDQSAAKLGADGMLRRLLPDDPAVLLSVALYAYPRRQETAIQQPFFVKGLALLESRGSSLPPGDWVLKANLCALLNKPAEAIEALQTALTLRPGETAWRFQLATFLHQQQRDKEALYEVRLLLDREPAHPGALELSAILARKAAEGKLPTGF